MGRHAKSTRGGNKHRINPGRLAKKFTKQGMSEKSAGVAARTAVRLSKQQTTSTTAPATAGTGAQPTEVAQQQQAEQVTNSVQQQQQFTSKKNAIAHALAQLKQQRTMQEERTVVKQAQRRR